MLRHFDNVDGPSLTITHLPETIYGGGGYGSSGYGSGSVDAGLQ